MKVVELSQRDARVLAWFETHEDALRKLYRLGLISVSEDGPYLNHRGRKVLKDGEG